MELSVMPAQQEGIAMKHLLPKANLLISIALMSPLSGPPALATPGSGFAPQPLFNGHFGQLDVKTADEKTGHWGVLLKTKDDTDMSADQLTIQPGGYSGWHAHPGPVFVTVTQGTIIWIDGSNPLCSPATYSAGQSFIEPAYGIHNVRNASQSSPAAFFATTIKPVGFVGPAFRLDRPKPNNCDK